MMKRLITTARVSEVADIAHRLSELYAEQNNLQSNAFLKNLFEKIQLQAMALSAAMNREIAISNLEQADDLRDETIINLHNILLGHKSMPTTETRERAEKLYAVFDRYGTRITRENYSSESAYIEALLRDFAAPHLQEAINGLLGVADTLAELRERQTHFANERMAYNKAVAQQQASDSATSLKKPLVALINNKLVNYMTALQDEEGYQEFAKMVAKMINDTNEIVLRRSKKE